MLDMYRLLYLIRRCEESIQENYNDDKMKTPMHMSMGSEAAVAGVCKALSSDDQVLGTYRSHALYLAKTLDVDGFFSEMYGKKCNVFSDTSKNLHEAKILKLDCTKSQTKLGWMPKTDIEKGLQMTVDWYKEYENQNDAYG